MMTAFMDFGLCSGLSVLLLNQNTEYDVSLLGGGVVVVKNYALTTKILSLSTLLQLRRLCSVN